jgi:hypothetical protein
MADLDKMSKKELESYARKELGLELDRRQSKKQLLERVKEAEKIIKQVQGARDTIFSTDTFKTRDTIFSEVAKANGVEKIVEILKPPAGPPDWTPSATKPKAKAPEESKIRNHLEKLRMERRDASIIWDEINNKDLNDEDLREIIRSHNFGTLLGKVSQ